MNKKLIIYLIAFAVFAVTLYYSSLHLLHGDVVSNTDTARDILLIEEMVNTNSPDLIGPRAGGISGIFFGPIWYYAAIPFFIIGNGNPISIGIFWLLAVILSVISVFWVSKKLFGEYTGLLTAVLYAVVVVPSATGFTQSFGSLILSPVIFYLLYKFSENTGRKYLITLVLMLGILFHLQPAFAMLVIFMSFIYTSIILIKRKQATYILYYLLILIPLSNYIVFELRNDFLHVNSLLNFLTNPPVSRTEISFGETLANRIEGFLSRLNILGLGGLRLNILFLGINGFILYKAITDKNLTGRKFYFIFFGFYIFFWILSFLFKGLVWDFYHWAFLPLVCIIFVSLRNMIPKQIFIALYIIVFSLLLLQSKSSADYWINNYSNHNSSSWLLNKNIAEYVINDSDGQSFGYYVYSPDEFGYPIKYALNYSLKESSTEGVLCEKHPITYLIYYPTPEVGAKTDPEYWKDTRVNISKSPDNEKIFGEGVLVEKYTLTEEEIQLESDPNLICDLHFR